MIFTLKMWKFCCWTLPAAATALHMAHQDGSSFIQSDQHEEDSIQNGHVRPTPDPDPVLLGGEPFDRQMYFDGLAAGGLDGLDMSDRPFYPQIYYDGEYHPICGIDFNDAAAATACRDIERATEANSPWEQKERLNYGGHVVKTNVVLERDAMPVGACRKGESLDSCTAGSNAFGDFTALDGRCKKGNPVGVQIVCNRKCRKFGQFVRTEENLQGAVRDGVPLHDEKFEGLEVCGPFLKNTSTYYLEGLTAGAEEPQGNPSILAEFKSLFNVLNDECLANVLELICHSFFKECKAVEVEDPFLEVESVLLPSLLCKEECERHKVVWDECVAKIEKDSDDKALFDSNMMIIAEGYYLAHFGSNGEALPRGPGGAISPFALLDCNANAGGAYTEIAAEDVTVSWFLGRYPQTSFNFGPVGWAFPRFMLPGALYPEVSSTYMGPDGVSHEVPCTIPKEADAFQTECPDLFTKSILPETNRACVYACPVNQFSLQEYTTMWNVFVAIGICSFMLNLFMVCTWKLAGRLKFDAMPFQLKACVFLGLLYGLLVTIPSATLKFDLPCTHDTVEEVGNSALCTVSRIGQYILLGIMVNLCALTFSIYRALVNATHHESNMNVNVLTNSIPIVFMVIAYSLDTDEEDTENYNLNVARHAFSCSMRFSSMLEEWLVLWLPFCVSGVLTAFFSVASSWKIGDIQRSFGMASSAAYQEKSEGQKTLEGQRRRLIRIAAMVSACLLLSVGTALSVTGQQSAWTEYEEKKLDCIIKTSHTRNWEDYGFNLKDAVQNVCMVEDEDHMCRRIANLFQMQHPLEDPKPITIPCEWNPARRDHQLVCNYDQLLQQYPEEVRQTQALDNPTRQLFGGCDCPCSDLLKVVERPSLFVMTVSFAAQSMIAAIVALNLGFRQDNLNLWNKFINSTIGSKKSTQA